MSEWRRRLWCGVAILFLTSTTASAEISIALDELRGEIVVRGLSAEMLVERNAEDILEVAVAVGNDAPAILGDYRVEGDTLRFRPMFPFDPGREYVVRLDVSPDTIVTIVTTVSLPARDIAPTTVVRKIYPTTDTLPENQLKFYIHFSAPMAGGDGLQFVKLLDENGDEVVDPFLPLGNAFWARDYRRYTVFFDPGRVKRGILPNEQMGRPILDGHRYTLVIDRQWRDAEGVSLAGPYRKEFIAGPPDETPIDPEAWTIHPPRAGTREPLVVDFTEPLDRAVLVRALALEDVEGEVEITHNETRWVFTPALDWIAGSYELIALAVLEDLAGNQIGKPFEVDIFERIDSPDDIAETYRIPIVISLPSNP